MTDERYKQIMTDLGMPSNSYLLSALQQVANETEQTVRKQVAAECAKICEDLAAPSNLHWKDESNYDTATIACETAIKLRFDLKDVEDFK